jgi:mannosyltransferase
LTEDTDRQARLFGVAVALATALAAAFVLWHLGRAPLDRDEVASVTDAHRSLGGTLDVLWAREGNMWPYYLFLNGWTHLGGTGEAWVRLPAALCAIGSVPVTMFLARRLFGDLAAVLSGVALACSPMLLETAQFARAYGVILLLVVISATLLVAGVRRPRRGTWIAWGLVSGFAAHFHMLSVLVVAAQAASLLLLPRDAVPWRDVRAGAIALLVVIAPMVVYALLGDSGQTSWVPALSAHELAGFGKSVTGSRPLELLVALLYVFAAWALLTQVRREGRSEDAWRQGLVLGWIVLPPLALAVLSVAKPLFTPNYLVGVLPAVPLLVGMVATRPAPPLLHRVALPAAVLAVALTVVAQVRHDHPTAKGEDLRAAARFVAARAQPGDGLAYGPAFARPGFTFYFARANPAAQPADLDLEPGRGPLEVGDLFGQEDTNATVAANLQRTRRVWLIGYPVSSWHPTPEPVLAVAPRILHARFTNVTTRRFGDFQVALWQRR